MFEVALVSRKNALIHLCNLAQQHIENAPDGKLALTKSHGVDQYRWKKADGTTVYIKQSQNSFAKSLAQKEYAQKVLVQASKELRNIDRLLQSSHINGPSQSTPRAIRQALAEMDTVSEIYLKAPEAKRKLIDPFVLPISLFEDEWRTKVEDDNLYSEGRVFQTESGLMVRSKSEVIIADKLFHAGIPFKYEQPVKILGSTVYPDFVILNTQTREELIWEHFGMMDDISYCNHFLKKISLYASKGILLGDRLIATFESSAIPLDTAVVDRQIALLRS